MGNAIFRILERFNMSIKINYCGRFGNNLFQYAAGIVVSELTNLKIQTSKIGHFEAYDINNKKNEIHNNEITIGQKNLLDIEQIKNHKGSFCLSGFFQDYRNFVNHKNLIKQNYSFKKIDIENNENSLCLHLRLTDYCDINFCLPNDFIIDTVNNLNYEVVNIVSDDKSSNIVKYITKNLNKKVNIVNTKNNEWEDFVFIASSKNIFISMSTYSWWAAFLSDANKIFFPKSPKMYWNNQSSDDKVVFEVYDENRYIYI